MKKPAPTEYDVHELIRERWSPRAFADRPVPAEILCQLLEAARWAASSFNEQPWAYLVARRADAHGYRKMLECLVPANQEWAARAPVLMISVARGTFERNEKPNRHAWHDVGQASAQLTLPATALGLLVHQMAGIDRDKICEAYALPDGCSPVAGIALGYPAEVGNLPDDERHRALTPRQRKPLGEFVFSERFGDTAGFVK